MRCISTIFFQLLNNHCRGGTTPPTANRWLKINTSLNMTGKRKRELEGEASMTGKRKQESEGESSMHSCLQCSSKFKQKFTLTRHIKTVHTREEFECDQCASSFGRKDDLAKHKRRKHTLQKCEECDFSTYKNHELANHMLEMHPPDNWIEESAFNRKIIVRTFKVNGEKSPLDVLKDYEGKIRIF